MNSVNIQYAEIDHMKEEVVHRFALFRFFEVKKKSLTCIKIWVLCTLYTL